MENQQQDTITVLIFPVGKEPEIENIPRGLEPMQKIVGGLIQLVPVSMGSCALEVCCNEEGKFEGLAPNRFLEWGDVLVGDFFVTKTDYETGEGASLTPEDIEAAKKYFAGKEVG